EPLVAEQQRGAPAKPRLELRIEGKWIKQGPSLRRVVLRSIEDGPPPPLRRENDLRQAFARIAGGNDFHGVKALRFQPVQKRLDILLAGENRISQNGVSGNRPEGQEDPAQVGHGNKSIRVFGHIARSTRFKELGA